MSDKRISFKVDGEVQDRRELPVRAFGPNSTNLTSCARSFTSKQAKNLGLTGFVTNVSDGTVQGEAQGSADAIKEFVQHLNKGPSAASVNGVEQSDISTKSGEGSFNVQ
ncbi:hypothetical protein N0V90_002581 [Kalmusia sp. IMI 367209]|nr:hypothetical protein N0V90_002581 [Kalmusia sp. IMI 367209]